MVLLQENPRASTIRTPCVGIFIVMLHITLLPATHITNASSDAPVPSRELLKRDHMEALCGIHHDQ